jgi:hypothetical protein
LQRKKRSDDESHNNLIIQISVASQTQMPANAIVMRQDAKLAELQSV